MLFFFIFKKKSYSILLFSYACIEIYSLIEYRLSENVKCFVRLCRDFFLMLFLWCFNFFSFLNSFIFEMYWSLLCFLHSFLIVKDKKTLRTQKGNQEIQHFILCWLKGLKTIRLWEKINETTVARIWSEWGRMR